MRNLAELYKTHDGKVSDKWNLYLHQYQKHFHQYRNEKLRILEIGIQNGGSLEIWEKFFPNAELIVGCDINPRCEALEWNSDKIKVVIGNANYPETKRRISSLSGNYDIIIDDGSHSSSDIITSFANYFGSVSDGGLYVIEDLYCSYWETHGGGIFHPLSSMAFLKRLADILNYESWGVRRSRESIIRLFEACYGISFSGSEIDHINSIEFANSICFVGKNHPQDNRLGKEWIVGSSPTVDERVNPKSEEPRLLRPPPQTSNPWSNPVLLPEEEALRTARQTTKRGESPFQTIGTITVVINNRNLLTWPKAMIGHIENFNSLAEVIIVDNGSTYQPLLDYYETKPCKIIRTKNLGHTAPWFAEINSQIKTDFYVVSDPDLDLAVTPLDTLEHLAMCLFRFPCMGKIGLSLEISTIAPESPYFGHVNSYEKDLTRLPLISNLIRPAPVDTTFAIYNKKLLNEYRIRGARTDAPYKARHIPWEITEPDEEFLFYLENANQSSSYNSFIANKAIKS